MKTLLLPKILANEKRGGLRKITMLSFSADAPPLEAAWGGGVGVLGPTELPPPPPPGATAVSSGHTVLQHRCERHQAAAQEAKA